MIFRERLFYYCFYLVRSYVFHEINFFGVFKNEEQRCDIAFTLKEKQC